MKNLSLLLAALLTVYTAYSQTQLDVQGTHSTYNVAQIDVNYSGASDVIGLQVNSYPNGSGSPYGTAGDFNGGKVGVYGYSNVGIGVISP